MNIFTSVIDFNVFTDTRPLHKTKYTSIETVKKKASPSKKYILKKFRFNCIVPREQKVITEVFSQIFSQKNQYIKSYKRYSFTTNEPDFYPTFSMSFISEKTLEKVLNEHFDIQKWTKETAFNCMFAVAQGLSYLHDHLMCHGNLCPSNVVVDKAEQCYLIDFGLYPIKKLYVEEDEIADKDYRDPGMGAKCPTRVSDVYSFGVLMSHLCVTFLQGGKVTLRQFLANDDPHKYDHFPKFVSEIIPKCVDRSAENRPTISQVIKMFQDETYKIHDYYSKFIKSMYIENLANLDDPSALNKLGCMHLRGELPDTNDHEKALFYFKKSADLKYSEGMCNYGALLIDMYDEGSEEEKEGTKLLRASTNQGNVNGIMNYGIIMSKGKGVKKNINEGEKYLKLAADSGSVKSQVAYGYSLITNNPNHERIEEGLKYIRKAMDMNNKDAFNIYGTLLLDGTCVEKNEKLAMHFLKVAADLGHPDAMLKYADGNWNGIGVEKNHITGFEYYEKAAENGNQTAKNKIKDYISQKWNKKKNRISGSQDTKTKPEGNVDSSAGQKTEVKSDTKKTQKQLVSKPSDESIASNQQTQNKLLPPASTDSDEVYNQQQQQQNKEINNLQAHDDPNHQQEPPRFPKSISLTPSNDHPQPSNSDKNSLNVNPNSSEKNLTKFFNELRYEYYESRISENDDKTNFRLFQVEDQLINIRNSHIIYKYAKLYKQDDGNLQSQEKAMNYFKMSADLGYAKAQIQYGLLLQKGECVVKDENLGTKYLKMAADQGSKEGQYLYGKSLCKGIGVEKNEEEGKKYLKMSADQEYSIAQLHYGIIESDPIVGHKYIEKAVENNCPEAHTYYAEDFVKGRGVEKDYGKAFEIYVNIFINNKEKDNSILVKIVELTKMFDMKLAVGYMKKLADSNDYQMIAHVQKAQFEYGLELVKGECVKRNVKEALEYFTKSQTLGKVRDEFPQIYALLPHDFTSVKENVENFLHRRGQVDINEYQIIDNAYKGDANCTLKAAKLFEKAGDFNTANFFYEIAADSNQPEASFVVAKNYLEGRNGCKIDQAKGSKYMKRARDLGYKEGSITQSSPSKQTNTSYQSATLQANQNEAQQITANRFNDRFANSSQANQNEVQQIATNRFNDRFANSSQANQNEVQQIATNRFNDWFAISSRVNQSASDSRHDGSFADSSSSQKVSNEVPIEISRLFDQLTDSQAADDDAVDMSLPASELMERGDTCSVENPTLAMRFYLAAAEKGDASGYFKCAEQCTTIDEKLDYYELAIDKGASNAFSKWRARIFKLFYSRGADDLIPVLVKHLQRYENFADISYLYLKAKDEANCALFYEKAKKNTENIKDDQQQYEFAHLCQKFNDSELEEEMYKRASQQGNKKARKKLEHIAQAQPTGRVPLLKASSVKMSGTNQPELAKSSSLNDGQSLLLSSANSPARQSMISNESNAAASHLALSQSSSLNSGQNQLHSSASSPARQSMNSMISNDSNAAASHLALSQSSSLNSDHSHLLSSTNSPARPNTNNFASRGSDLSLSSSPNRPLLARSSSLNSRQTQLLSDAESLVRQGVNLLDSQSYDLAFDAFKKASDLGSGSADFYLGRMYKRGCGSLAENRIYAALHFKRSAERNDANGQNAFGDCLREGFGVEKNIDRAIHFYRLAASQGMREASYNYGREKFLRSTSDAEKENLARFLKIGADMMIPDALFLYSQAIKNNDPENSKRCFQLAIEKGSKMAKEFKNLS